MARKINRIVEHLCSVSGGEVVSCILYKDNNPIPLAGHTVEFAMWTTDSTGGSVKRARTSTGVTKEPTQTSVYNAATGKLRCVNHGLETGDKIAFSSIGSTTGIGTSVNYFVRDETGDYFNVCLEEGGVAIALGGSGNAVFYMVGHAQYTPQGSDLTTAGTFYGAFFTTTPNERYPANKEQNGAGQNSAAGMIKVIVS